MTRHHHQHRRPEKVVEGAKSLLQSFAAKQIVKRVAGREFQSRLI